MYVTNISKKRFLALGLLGVVYERVAVVEKAQAKAALLVAEGSATGQEYGKGRPHGQKGEAE